MLPCKFIQLFYPTKQSLALLIVTLLLSGVSVSVHAEKDKLHVLIDDGRLAANVGTVDKVTTSSAYSVIEAERFRNSFTSLPEVLEQEVGVQIRATGGAGSVSTIVLRGASSEQVIIYIDGVAINSASGGLIDLSFVDIDSIERIEVYRGSTPLALGSPSIGGAVNIITRRSTSEDSESSGKISASVASFQTYKLNGSASVSHNQEDLLFSASYLQSENDFSYLNDNGTQFNSADDRVEKRNNDGVEQLSLLANWKHEISAQYDTDVRLDYFDRAKEIPSATNNADVQTQLDTQQYNLLGQLNGRNVWTDDFSFNAKVFASRKDEVFDDSLAQVGFFDQRIESITEKIGAQFYGEQNFEQSQWKFLTGFSQENYHQDSSIALVEAGDNTRDRTEVSVENTRYFNQQRFILNLVLRYQGIRDELSATTDSFGTLTPAVKNNYTFLNPQLGVKYRFNQQTFFTVNVGQYERAPSFLELFGGDGLLIGNTDLKQETSINTDMGLTYTWFKPYSWLHNTELYAGVFYNSIEDLIVRIYNGQGIGVPQNISDAIIQGFETTVKLSPAKNHSVNANLSLIDSVNQTDITAFNGKVLPGYYQQSFSLYYGYTLNQWLLSAEADIKRNMFYDRGNLLKGDDVNLLNLGVRRYFNHSNIDFRVDNILDENIQYFRNRPTPGLSLSLTYNHSF